LLGLKYDRLHLPLLGRLARIVARNQQVVTRLRAATSPTKIRGTLLQLDAEEMEARLRATSDGQPAVQDSLAERMSSARPALDREMRLRAIRRISAQRATDAPPTGRRSARGGNSTSNRAKPASKGETAAKPAKADKGSPRASAKAEPDPRRPRR
ncbi:MAG TPA: hypothetical protein VNO33_06965, partial [Kofleriaceae bacterium]|nr:hypothetical protein [Kofleriaceae bacterium]